MLRTLAASQKHHGFADERETRYIVSIPPESDSRLYRTSRDGRLVTYVPLAAVGDGSTRGSESAKLPIRAVMIGPPSERRSEKKTVERFLVDRGHKDVAVSISEVPYTP